MSRQYFDPEYRGSDMEKQEQTRLFKLKRGDRELIVEFVGVENGYCVFKRFDTTESLTVTLCVGDTVKTTEMELVNAPTQEWGIVVIDREGLIHMTAANGHKPEGF